MKVRRRKNRLHPALRRNARVRRWKPGQSGNPAGSNAITRTLGTSFKQLIRQLFESPTNSSRAKAAKQELVEVALKKAKRGNFFFWSKLIDLHESQLVNEDDLQDFVEKVYVTVRRHVEKLDGGREALAEIARELQKENSNEP